VARIAVIFAVVMGGVYAGWFTVTESGALGAAFAAVMLVVELRKEGLSVVRGSFASALREAAVTTSMSFFVLIGSSVLTFFLISAGIPTAFTRWIVALDVPGELIVLALLAAMIPLGMFLDSLSIVIIVIPLAYPVVTALGFDGVWFAILFVKMIELGQITPPVGINVYVVSGVSGVKPETVFRGILPFIALDVVIMLIFFTFPQVVLWLPNALLGP
jgi:TRAP-type C4-dicarboxylate transport system permease large subunit